MRDVFQVFLGIILNHINKLVFESEIVVWHAHIRMDVVESFYFGEFFGGADQVFAQIAPAEFIKYRIT